MERKFNFVVKALIVDALRAVCRHNGRTRKGAPDTHGHTVISLEGANERAEAADAGERVVRPAEVADPDAEAEYDAVVDRLLGRRALQWLPHLPPRQRGIVEDRVLAGKEWKDVAARAGISIKWAKQELDEALAALKALLTEQP
jgi:DNA-directed RNA polymerase specialized sigma24 family protein